MRVSLRGARDQPMLCFELDSSAYTVDSALDWVKEQSVPLNVPSGVNMGMLRGDAGNLFEDPVAWPGLLALEQAVNAHDAWTRLQKIPGQVPYLPPILDPPLFFGLAGNCPMTWRPDSRAIPNYPVGYTRTRHTIGAHLGRIHLPSAVTSFRCAVELGVVIGRQARNVLRHDAMQYVAGYTIVNDMISNHWKDFALRQNPENAPSFEEQLITSYYGRGTAGFAPFGPYIVNREAVDNPYDLMMYSRINGSLIDRSYTNAMVVGIESAIEYLSRYFSLEPGSVIHMGTMGLDGITLSEDKRLGRDDNVEMEIEGIGSLKVFFDDCRLSAQ